MRASHVNRALGLPRLSYGVSSKALGYVWGPAALAVVMVGTSQGWLWSLIPLATGATIHGALQWAYRKDPRIFEMYAKYSILSTSYHPHVREVLPLSFERPAKVGRGIRL